MRRELPDHVDIVGTHPLFGPQSGRDGIAGLKIAVCPIRGRRGLRVAAFLRAALRLKVYVTTPEAHDREAATVQGLTHLIAKVLVKMEPLPTRMTTASFDMLMKGVDMVRYDAPEVFMAIERANPYSAEVRQRFFRLAAELDGVLTKHTA
jgi:prephenate dehydrogenase